MRFVSLALLTEIPTAGEFQLVVCSSLRSRHSVFGWRSGSPLR